MHKFRDDEVMITFHGERVHGKLRAVPDARRRLDDPPDGPAGRPGPRADARAARADARPHAARCRPTTAAGRTRSSGTACARSPSSRAGRLDPAGAQRQRHHRRATPSCARSPRRSPAARSCSTARSSRSTARRPSFQKLQGRMHLTSRRADPPARARGRRSTTSSSTCSTSTGARCCDLPYEERRAAARRARAGGPDLAGAGAPRRRRRRAAAS